MICQKLGSIGCARQKISLRLSHAQTYSECITDISLHKHFPLRISPVNAIKSAGNRDLVIFIEEILNIKLFHRTPPGRLHLIFRKHDILTFNSKQIYSLDQYCRHAILSNIRELRSLAFLLCLMSRNVDFVFL